MFRKISYSLPLCIVFSVAIGCAENIATILPTEDPSVSLSTLSIDGETSMPSSLETTANPGGNQGMNEITIYDLSRDIYYRFIENPSKNILEEEGIASFVYPEQGEVFFRDTRSPFRVNSALIDFAGDMIELKKYLAQNSIIGDIKNTALVHTAKTPMTIWEETDQGNFFISVDEVPPDLNSLPYGPNDWHAEHYSYVYSFYTQSEFLEKFANAN